MAIEGLICGQATLAVEDPTSPLLHCGQALLAHDDPTSPELWCGQAQLAAEEGGPARPTLTQVWPQFGPGAGGTPVTVTGTDLIGTTAVEFGPAAATAMVVVDPTTITCTTPAGIGVVDVRVRHPAGDAVRAAHYQYPAVVSDVQPNPGARGGTVTLTGMALDSVASVQIGREVGNPVGLPLATFGDEQTATRIVVRLLNDALGSPAVDIFVRRGGSIDSNRLPFTIEPPG